MASTTSITQSPGIAGKVIVITGASSGIGEDGARYLAARGASVVLGARRADKLKTIVDEITAAGGKAAYATVDVTKAEEVKALVQKAVDTFGKLDVIINNAGLMSIAPLSETKVSEWDSMIDINIKGVLYGIAAALPIFEKQGHGHFINISSIAGLKVFAPGGTVYSGTKYAVRAISEGLRMEVSGKIRTTIISPGAVESELKHGTSHSGSADFVKDFYKNNEIPTAAISRAFAYAIEQPPEVDISEIVVRPTVQDF